jgi:hypothetical protein
MDEPKKPRKPRKDKGKKRTKKEKKPKRATGKPTYIGAYRDTMGRPTMAMEVLNQSGVKGGAKGISKKEEKIGRSSRQSGADIARLISMVSGQQRPQYIPQTQYDKEKREQDMFKKFQEDIQNDLKPLRESILELRLRPSQPSLVPSSEPNMYSEAGARGDVETTEEYRQDLLRNAEEQSNQLKQILQQKEEQFTQGALWYNEQYKKQQEEMESAKLDLAQKDLQLQGYRQAMEEAHDLMREMTLAEDKDFLARERQEEELMDMAGEDILGNRQRFMEIELTAKRYEQAVNQAQEERAVDAEWYEGELSRRSLAEADTLREISSLTESRIAEVEAEKQKLQQAYAGLQGQTRAESLANEERLFQLTRRGEELQVQLAEEQAAKEALRASQAEELAKRQQEQDKQSALIARLQEDIDIKKAQMEEFKTSVSRSKYDEDIKQLQKQLAKQEAELKYAREQASKGDKLIVKQQMEKLGLEQALGVATTPQKGQAEERAENYRETIEQMRDQFEEERQALKAQISQAQSQRDLIQQFALQQEEEYNQEVATSNAEFERINRELAREGLMSMFFETELKRTKKLPALAPLQIPEAFDEPMRSPRMRSPKPPYTAPRLVSVLTDIHTSPREAPPPQQRPDVEQAQEEEPIPVSVLASAVIEKPQGPSIRRIGLKPKTPSMKPEERQPSLDVSAFAELKGIPPPREKTPRPVPKRSKSVKVEGPVSPVESINPMTRSMSQETTASEQEINRKELERQASELGVILQTQPQQISQRAMGLFSAPSLSKPYMRPNPVKAPPGKETTALLRASVESRKLGGERPKLQLQKRSEQIDDANPASVEIIRPQVDETLQAQEEVSLDLTNRREGKKIYNTEVQNYNATKSQLLPGERKLEKLRIKALEREVRSLPKRPDANESVIMEQAVQSDLAGSSLPVSL